MLDFALITFSYFLINVRALILHQPIKGLAKGIFWGYTHFSIVPNSSVVLGKKVRFRSSAFSNLIGLNHRCIISTLENGDRLCMLRPSRLTSSTRSLSVVQSRSSLR